MRKSNISLPFHIKRQKNSPNSRRKNKNGIKVIASGLSRVTGFVAVRYSSKKYAN